MTKEQILKHLENQIDFFVYELKRSIVNSAITGRQDATIWDKFKGFMQNLYYGKANQQNPNFSKNLLGHGLGKETNENKIISLQQYRFLKEWHNNLESSIKPINENYSTPEIPTYLKNTQLNKIIDAWGEKFKRAIFDSLKSLLDIDKIPMSSTEIPQAKKTPKSIDPQKASEAPTSNDASIPPDSLKTSSETPKEIETTSSSSTISSLDASASEPTKPTEIQPVEDSSVDISSQLQKAKSIYAEKSKDIRTFNKHGGGSMPRPYVSKKKIAGETIQNLPYVLRLGDPRIDLIKYGNRQFFDELFATGRIESENKPYGESITDEDKINILRKRFTIDLEKLKNIKLNAEMEKLQQDTKNVVFDNSSSLQQIIDKIQEYKNVPKSTSSIEEEEETDEKTEKDLEIKDTDMYLIDVDKLLSYHVATNQNFLQEEQRKDFLIKIFNEPKSKKVFSEDFQNKIKSLEDNAEIDVKGNKISSKIKINYDLANLDNISYAEEINNTLQSITDPEKFQSTVLKICNLVAIERFIEETNRLICDSESKTGKVYEKTTKQTIAEFFKNLKQDQKKYFEEQIVNHLRKIVQEKHFLPEVDGVRSFEAVKNKIDSMSSNNQFEDLINFIFDYVFQTCKTHKPQKNLTRRPTSSELLGMRGED